MLQSENGMLGMGPYPTERNDPDLINAERKPSPSFPAAHFHMLKAGMIRAGKSRPDGFGRDGGFRNGDIAN
jgi:acyl CoA:acetate/3-ketoacid CoA transferase beta subunit